MDTLKRYISRLTDDALVWEALIREISITLIRGCAPKLKGGVRTVDLAAAWCGGRNTRCVCWTGKFSGDKLEERNDGA